MGQGTFFMFLPAVIGVSFVGFLAIAVAVFQDGRHEANRADIVKRGYIYLVAFVTILLVTLSAASVLDLGFRKFAFTHADPVPGFFQEQPPVLFLSSQAKTAEVPTTGLTCTNGCTLSDQQKQDIATWAQSFANWKDRTAAARSVAQSLVTPLSFLIIAGLVFLFHWRLVLRDRNRIEEAHNITRSTYFSAMSFIWLITAVFSAGFLLNTVLKSAIPGAAQNTSTKTSAPITAEFSGGAGTESIITCGTACGIPESTISLAREWKTENDAWIARQNSTSKTRDRDNNLATELAFLIAAAPLFWYHFRAVWREKKQPPTQTV